MVSGIHPDLNAPIPIYMRTSAFVFSNIPIIGGMILSAPTPFNTFFFQWLNQTYNAGLNYGNRNASSTQTSAQMFTSYAIAVTSAIGMAAGLKRGLAPLMRGREGTMFGSILNSIVNFGAVATTSAMNCVMMRSGELTSGIDVKDASGETIGLSQTAAYYGIQKTAISRAVYNFPIFFIPPVLVAMQAKAGMHTRPGVKLALEVSNVAFALLVSMPLGCALFP